MRPRPYKGWLAVGIVTTTAVVVDRFLATVAKPVHEFLEDESNCMAVRVAIGVIGGMLIAAAIVVGLRARLKYRRQPVDVESDRFAIVLCLIAAPLVEFVSFDVALNGICTLPILFMLASFMLLFVCSAIVAVRTGRKRWILLYGMYFALLLIVASVLFPA